MLRAIADATEHPPRSVIQPLRWLRDFDAVTYAVSALPLNAKARSRHFHEAYKRGADMWVSFDEGVTLTKETLGWLVALANQKEPVVAMAPCALRNGIANVAWSAILVETSLPGGGKARRFEHGGLEAFAMNRAAMTKVQQNSSFFVDGDGERKAAAFVETLDRERWHSDAGSFYRRLPRDVDRWGLVTGQTTYENATINLSELPAR